MFRAAYFQDISERKKSEEILRQSEKMAAAGRVAATISHEINNPLAAITNLIYLAKSESSAEQIREYLEMADRELKHVTNLSKTALGFYRTSNKIQVVDMGVVVESVTSIYRRAMDKKNLRLVLQLRPEIQVMGLEAELKQVVSNLVSNAMDACPQRGSLCIRVRCVAGQVQLSIADTGSGIPAADTHRIFEPFFTANKANGTGLGLWISQQIIERHKGRIRVYSSTREGKSFSVFSVLLPAVAGQSVAVA
jgi:signal transduction histidine kinase